MTIVASVKLDIAMTVISRRCSFHYKKPFFRYVMIPVHQGDVGQVILSEPFVGCRGRPRQFAYGRQFNSSSVVAEVRRSQLFYNL